MDTLTEQKKNDLIEIAHVAASPFIVIWRILQTVFLVIAVVLTLAGTWLYHQGYNVNMAFVNEIQGYDDTNLLQDAFGNREVHSPRGNKRLAPNVIVDADGWIDDLVMADDGNLKEPPGGMNPVHGPIGPFPANVSLFQAADSRMNPSYSLNEVADSGMHYTGLAEDKAAAIPGICETGHDYDTQQRYSIFEWGQRNTDAIRRKSARMQAAYDNGIIMSSAMRRVFAYMKLHPGVPIPEDSPMFQPGSTENVCIANPWHPGMTKQEFEESNEAIHQVQSIMTTFKVTFYDHKVVGLCTVFCDYSDQLPYLSEFHDIFDDVPPLSPRQLDTVQMLNDQSTDERWLAVAHGNDIYDDRHVVWYAAQARKFRDRVMFPSGKPYYAEMK